MAEPASRPRRAPRASVDRDGRRPPSPERERERLLARDAYAGYYDFELDDPSLADELLDDLLPPNVDWRRMVRNHPWPALLLAGLGGYLLGRNQGRALVGALAGLAVAKVEDRVLGLVDSELDDED